MKNAMIISALIAGSAVLGAGVVAIAQEDAPPPPRMEGGKGMHPHGPGMMQERLEDLDINNDGQITKAEIDAKEDAVFAEIDTNRDGFASAEEMTAHHERKKEEMRKMMEKRKHQKMVEKLDADGDGKISKAEFTSRPNPMFDKVDTNGDGIVDADEMAKAKERMKDRMKDRDGKFGKGDHHGFRR